MTPPPRTEPLQNDEHEHSVRVVSDRDIFALNEKICYICVSNETVCGHSFKDDRHGWNLKSAT